MSAKYRLVGGPMEGELVDPPRGYLVEAAEKLIDKSDGLLKADGPITPQMWVGGKGVYEFSDDEPGVMVWRDATPEERAVYVAMARQFG